MIKIIKNPKLSKEEIRIAERKLGKIREDLEHYANELVYYRRWGTDSQIERAQNKLNKLNKARINLQNSIT